MFYDVTILGKTEAELPEARRGHEGAEGVDNHPWIWKNFRKQGYVTQWGEDGAKLGTFTYRMLGFTYQPVDHYMRPFYIRVTYNASIQHWHALGNSVLTVIFVPNQTTLFINQNMV